MSYYSSLTLSLFIQKFFVRKGSSFCARGLWRLGKLLMWVEKVSNFQRFWYLNIPCLRINVTFTFMSSSSAELTHLQKHSKTAVSVGFRRPYLCPSKRHQHSVSIQSLIYWVKRFSEYLAQMSRNNLQQLYFISKPLLYNKIEHNPQVAKALEAGCVNIHVNK